MATIGKHTGALAGALLFGLGCTGAIGDGQSKPGEGPGQGNGAGGKGTGTGGAGGGEVVGGPGTPGPASFRRLTRVEYNNTIRDLLGDASNPANGFPGDTESNHSGFSRGNDIDDVDANRIFEATEKLTADALALLPDLLPCKPIPGAGPAQDACAQQFITQFGRRAFRRPLATEEVKAFSDLYTEQRTAVGQDFPNAIRVVMSAMLLSPNFLYRWELGPKAAIRDGELVRYNSWEMASRLSYLIWGSMPDEELWKAAEGNALSTPKQIEDQARRLVKSERAKDSFVDFFVQYLGVGSLSELRKNKDLYKDFSPELLAAMLAETRDFVGGVVKGDGKLETLLTSATTSTDPTLASVYGAAADRPKQRAGLLTQGSFLAMHATADFSHPVKRGVLILERMLCREPPPPPPDVGRCNGHLDGCRLRRASSCMIHTDTLGLQS